MVEYVIYTSTASKLMDEAELNELLSQCQKNNENNRLSGMLLYSDGVFMQLLEGRKEQLDNIYQKIKQDTRHQDIIELESGSIPERIFPHWTMGFEVLSKDQFSELDAYMHPSDHIKLRGEASHPAVAILKAFAEDNHLL